MEKIVQEAKGHKGL